MANNMEGVCMYLRVLYGPKRRRLRLIVVFIIICFMVFYMIPREPKFSLDFKLILPYIEPDIALSEKDMYLAVLVNSAAQGNDHRLLRDAIRKTWGRRQSSPINKKFTWRLFFSLGIANDELDHEANLLEARAYNDVLIGNFTDNYINVVIKTFMGHYWSVTALSCRYVLKTDDDVYVRVPSLVRWLVNSGSPTPFYGGYVSPNNNVNRDYRSPWYISKEQYNETYFPPWCHGLYYVLSGDSIPKYLNYTYIRKPFHTDDAYIGVASKELGVNATSIPGFTFEWRYPHRVRSREELLEEVAIGHRVEVAEMIKYQRFYDSLDSRKRR